jgi:hypothetical protein
MVILEKKTMLKVVDILVGGIFNVHFLYGRRCKRIYIIAGRFW